MIESEKLVMLSFLALLMALVIFMTILIIELRRATAERDLKIAILKEQIRSQPVDAEASVKSGRGFRLCHDASRRNLLQPKSERRNDREN